jgi:hypothetical protein
LLSGVVVRVPHGIKNKKQKGAKRTNESEPANFTNLQPVVVVHHRRHAVEAVPVELVLLHPPARVGDEEAEGLPVAVVEASAVGRRVFFEREEGKKVSLFFSSLSSLPLSSLYVPVLDLASGKKKTQKRGEKNSKEREKTLSTLTCPTSSGSPCRRRGSTRRRSRPTC